MPCSGRTRPIVVQGAGGARRRSSIASSWSSESLKPSAAKNLIPLSAYGLCEAETTAARSKPYCAEQQRGSGRRQDAAEEDVAAGGRHAGGERGLEHLAGLARVADHEDPRTLDPGLLGGGATERERELGGQMLTGDAANAVGAEVLTCHEERRPVRDAPASAC